jgi:hypothetical protein
MADGAIGGNAESCTTISRSTCARSKHSGHKSRCRVRSASRVPLSQFSTSSGERWGPGAWVISGPSYGRGEAKVSFFQMR